MKKFLRQPIVCVLGHVDSGKTSLLDKIRGSAVALREVGSMTQHIGASFFPTKILSEMCGSLSKNIGEINIPGLLVIDTPGHSAFMNLRKRGGSVADIAILVIDINKGFEPQTYESISILKSRKTPFIVAANKIDTVSGWIKYVPSFTVSFDKQNANVKRQLNDRLYSIIGSFSKLGFRADIFDRVADFTKTVAIIPLSAKTGEGLPELLAVLIGLTQQYLRQKLTISAGNGKGTVLEVKEEPGLGMTITAIIYQGKIRRGDTIVVGGREKPIVTKIKAILLPKPLDEIRDPRDKFTSVETITAAAGVKIAASEIESVLSGAPIYVARHEQVLEKLIREVATEVEKTRIITDKIGVILKADTLGSLEAITNELENNQIPIRIADVGDVSRREVIEASLIKNNTPLFGVILAFNVKILSDAKDEANTQGIPVFQNNIIYRLLDDYNDWIKREKENMIVKEMETLIRPGKVIVLQERIFRKSKPAVFGVKILAGRIKPGWSMVTMDGRNIGEIIQIQDKGKMVQESTIGMEVAISMKEPIIGRHFNEGDLLYIAVPENNVKDLYNKYQHLLTADDIQLLKELTQIMKKNNPLWGV